MSLASTVLIVRPSRFGFNPETARTNAFMDTGAAAQDAARLQSEAALESANLSSALERAGIEVIEWVDPQEDPLPDSIFPNNWISSHPDGTLALYPMEAPSRRRERRPELIQLLQKRFIVTRTLDLTAHEDNGRYLEGTGSLILDSDRRIAWAGISTRTDEQLALEWGRLMGHQVVLFPIRDRSGLPIYHTNVMMAVGASSAVICTESIPDASARARVLHSLREAGREIIEITFEQMNDFCGNQIELSSRSGNRSWFLSKRAGSALTPAQRGRLGRDSSLVEIDAGTIERVGGGGVRCMIAEIFLTKR